MKKFTVTATITKEVECTIEAESLEEAQEMVKDYEPKDFGNFSYFKLNPESIKVEEKQIPYQHLKAGE